MTRPAKGPLTRGTVGSERDEEAGDIIDMNLRLLALGRKVEEPTKSLEQPLLLTTSTLPPVIVTKISSTWSKTLNLEQSEYDLISQNHLNLSPL